jgi:pimeloyl-ACP methyl ester carboxylesterase
MTSETAAKTGYVPVNGLEMYYEIRGTGQPLVLLHGAFSAIGTHSDRFYLAFPRLGRLSGSSSRATGTPPTLIAH